MQGKGLSTSLPCAPSAGQGLSRIYSCPEFNASPITQQIDRNRMEEKEERKKKDTKKETENKNKPSDVS